MFFISCGEASGDMLGARFVQGLRAEGFGGDLVGMGGPRLQAEGVVSRWDWHALHLMGILDVLPAIPRLLQLRDEMAEAVVAADPEAVILVDSPDFHLPLALAMRKKGYTGRMYMIAPPTVWAWRPGRAKTLRDCCQGVFPLFDFEADWLSCAGVRAVFGGHPLLDELELEERDVSRKPRRIGLFPGSRSGEVRRLLPVLQQVAAALPMLGMEPVFSIAPDLRESLRGEMLFALSGYECWQGPGAELLHRCDAAVGASGTLAVEALLRDRFMVVAYKVSLSSVLAFKMLVRTPFVSIPNLLCGAVFPELLQWHASKERILAELSAYASTAAHRLEIHRRMAQGRRRLGAPGAGRRWAQTVLEDGKR